MGPTVTAYSARGTVPVDVPLPVVINGAPLPAGPARRRPGRPGRPAAGLTRRGPRRARRTSMHHGAVQTAARRPRDNSAWPKVAARRGLSRPARGFDLPSAGGPRPGGHSAGPRCHRRDAGAQPQALHARVRSPSPGRAGDLVHGAHSRILEHLRRELRARPGTYRVSRWATTGVGSRGGSVAQPSVGVVLTADGRDIDRGRGHDAARDWH